MVHQNAKSSCWNWKGNVGHCNCPIQTTFTHIFNFCCLLILFDFLWCPLIILLCICSQLSGAFGAALRMGDFKLVFLYFHNTYLWLVLNLNWIDSIKFLIWWLAVPPSSAAHPTTTPHMEATHPSIYSFQSTLRISFDDILFC